MYIYFKLERVFVSMLGWLPLSHHRKDNGRTYENEDERTEGGQDTGSDCSGNYLIRLSREDEGYALLESKDHGDEREKREHRYPNQGIRRARYEPPQRRNNEVYHHRRGREYEREGVED